MKKRVHSDLDTEKTILIIASHELGKAYALSLKREDFNVLHIKDELGGKFDDSQDAPDKTPGYLDKKLIRGLLKENSGKYDMIITDSYHADLLNTINLTHQDKTIAIYSSGRIKEAYRNVNVFNPNFSTNLRDTIDVLASKQ